MYLHDSSIYILISCFNLFDRKYLISISQDYLNGKNIVRVRVFKARRRTIQSCLMA